MAPRALPRPLSDDQLEHAAGHVCYEIEQMALGAHRSHFAFDVHLQNAILEAYLVHVRVLDEFLRKATPIGEDVLAVDFFDEPWHPVNVLSDTDREEVDRRIAHLTLRRSDGFSWGDDKTGQTRARLGGDIFRGLKRFVADLDQHRPDRAKWFAARHKAARLYYSQTTGGWMPKEFERFFSTVRNP